MYFTSLYQLLICEVQLDFLNWTVENWIAKFCPTGKRAVHNQTNESFHEFDILRRFAKMWQI